MMLVREELLFTITAMRPGIDLIDWILVRSILITATKEMTISIDITEDWPPSRVGSFNTMRPRKDGRHFPDD